MARGARARSASQQAADFRRNLADCITVTEAAEELRVSRWTVRRHVAALGIGQRMGKAIVFPRTALDQVRQRCRDLN